MDPPEWEAEPIADPCDEAAGPADTPVAAGLPLITEVLALPCAPIAPAVPLIEAPLAIAGIGGECGAIMDRGAELRRATRNSDAAAAGPRSDAGAPGDWTKDLEFADALAIGAACADCFVIPVNVGADACAACSIIPSRATGTLAPALIDPPSLCPDRIAVVGIAAS
jgi:hypothetical protein